MTGVFGSLTRQGGAALDTNPSARAALGGTELSGTDALVHLNLVLLGLMVASFAIQWVGAIREEEVQGRLEVVLCGTTTRTRWLGAQVAALVIGLLVVASTGSASLALSVAWSLGDSSQASRLVAAAAAQLPAAVVLGAAALALFGIRPGWQGLAWGWLVATGTVALLGGALNLPDWVRATSPTEHLGALPAGHLDGSGVAVCWRRPLPWPGSGSSVSGIGT